MKDWEIIPDNLSKAGRSWGWVSAIDSNGRTVWIADAHRDEAHGVEPVFPEEDQAIDHEKLARSNASERFAALPS